MPSGLLATMEGAFKTSFAGVVLHDGPLAAASAQAIAAEAYTAGNHIIFAETFNPRNINLLAHELAHVVQADGKVEFALCSDRNIEVEAEAVAARIVAGKSAGPVKHQLYGIARTTTSDSIRKLLSYGLTDWAVTADEEKQIMTLLWGDTNPNATVNDLVKSGSFRDLVDRVDGYEHQDKLIQLLGGVSDDATAGVIRPHIHVVLGQRYGMAVFPLMAMFDFSQNLQSRLRAMGITKSAPVFNTSSFASLISSDPTKPFTGVGATGKSPAAHAPIPTSHKAAMVAGVDSISALYDNPVKGMRSYLSSLTPAQRRSQATLLVKQKIVSYVPHSYVGKIPARKDIFEAAGSAHNLEPSLIAGFVLAEQRDQSANEDAKDYQAPVHHKIETSVGLGQVVISTARNGDLFADLLASSTRKGLKDWDIAKLLASDEFNIFAAARYLRAVANVGAGMNASMLPKTVAAYPGIDFRAYGHNSSTWPIDNVAALGSEYTSKPWDDELKAWSYFVVEAYKDVKAAGVF